MPDVFISYARASARQASAAASALREAGYSVWFDEDLPSHRAYGEVIEEQLVSAKAVLVIWSAEAAKSQWVRAEANRAREDGKLVQLRLDPSALPLPFDQVQCLDLTGWTGDSPHPAWSKVAAGVAGLVDGDAPRRRQAEPAFAEPTLAVLPFDAAQDGEAQALADGISEDILQGLTATGAIRVIGRTASFRFRGDAKAGAAAALHASHVLDGAVRRMGARVRVSVQLTEASGGAVLWGDRFDRDAADVFALQDELAARVGDAVLAHMPERPHAPVAAPSVVHGEGERRQVTVLACLISASERSAGPDPEQWRALVTRFQRAASSAVSRFGGYLAKSHGDGLEVYFGWPEAHEDAAERAVHAGMAIIAAMREPAGEGGVAQVRAGVDSGVVVVAVGEDQTVELFGDAARNAPAIAAAGAINCVTISGLVRDLASGRFTTEDAGESDAQVRLFRVLGAGSVSAGGARPSAPFVGRDAELAHLAACWRDVRDGAGRAAFVSGDAGIGKTRLLAEFRRQIAAEPHLWIEGAGAPLYVNTPFHAVVRLLDQGLGRRGGESPAERVARLDEALAANGARLAEATPLVAELLGLQSRDHPAPALPPDQKRARLLAALTGWLLGATRAQPVVVVVEDLQWADPSTLEFIQTLAMQGAGAPMLLVMSARPEFRPAWPLRSHHTQIRLGRLSDAQVRSFLEGMLGAEKLDDEAFARILRRTDGVPLFAEELARHVSSERGGATSEHAIPATLRDSLAARLDRLGPAKEVAQLAAVLGREAPHELVAALWQGPEDALLGALARLVGEDIIAPRGLAPDATYTFRQALMQDAAYDSLLKSRRRELHGLVARVIGARFPELGTAQPDMLARHWTEAGEAERAIAAWREAGDKAYERHAFREAAVAFGHALETLESRPLAPERDARELDLASRLARVLSFTSGYAAAETVAAAARAKALAEKTGRMDELIRQESRMWQATFTAGDYAAAGAIADHILDLAGGERGRPSHQMFARNAQLQAAFYTGDLNRAEALFADLSDMLQARLKRGGRVNGAISIGVAALTSWILGEASTADERLSRSAQYAEATGDPYDLAMNLHFSGILAACRRDAAAAEHHAERLLELAESNGLTYAAQLGGGTLAWAKAQRGDVAAGQDLVARTQSRPTGALVGHTFGLTMAAEIRALAGMRDAAEDTYERALSINPQERVFRPYTLNSRARFREAGGDFGAAEADFSEALALASGMSARMFQIDALEGCSRMLLRQGEGARARRLVDPYLPSLGDALGELMDEMSASG